MTHTVHDPDALPIPCHKPGHVPGCSGNAGGDHERLPLIPPLLWRAGRDRLAHAFRHRNPRTLCGVPVVREQLAWPTANVCPLCHALAEGGA